MSFLNRLSFAWRALLGKLEPDKADVVTFRRDLATAQLELQELKQSLERVRAQAKAEEKTKDSQVQDRVLAQLNELFSELAAPLSQLRMQEALLELGKPVGASDVMALAKKAADILERAGMEPIGKTGETMTFEPEIAQPLAGDASLARGEEVVVKFIGYRYQGRVLRKAMVEKL